MENLEKRTSGLPEKRSPLTGMEMRTGNLPGTDAYDDGLNEKGELVMPGSTSTESGGIYMEEKGPNNLVRKHSDVEASSIGGFGIHMKEISEPLDGEGENDAAAKWLRENDPTLQ